MVHETAHTETFVIDDAVAEVHTVDTFVNHLSGTNSIINEDGVVGNRIDMVEGSFNHVGILRVVDTIGIHVRTLEEVDTQRRRLSAVGFRFTTTIDVGTVVTITETTTDIATYIVVIAITEVNVSPRREVGTRQSIGGTVDDFIAVESHVVDFVVGGESKGLGTHLNTDGLTAGFGVGSTFIIEDPPQGLVAFQHLVSQDGAVHGSVSLLFHGRDLGVAEFVGNVIVGIVTVFGLILTITVGIVEGGQILGNAVRVFARTGSRPILNDGRNVFRIASLIVGEEFVNLSTGDLVNLIPLGASLGSDGGLAVDSQRASVVVITDLTETQGGALQLVVDVDTSNPKGAGKQRSS